MANTIREKSSVSTILGTISNGISTSFLTRNATKNEIYRKIKEGKAKSAVKDIENYFVKGGDLTKLDMDVTDYNGIKENNIISRITPDAITPNLLKMYQAQGLLNTQEKIYQKSLAGKEAQSINLLQKISKHFNSRHDKKAQVSPNTVNSLAYLLKQDINMSNKEYVDLLKTIDNVVTDDKLVDKNQNTVITTLKEMQNDLFKDKGILKAYCDDVKNDPNYYKNSNFVLDKEFKSFYQNLNNDVVDNQGISRITSLLKEGMPCKLAYIESTLALEKEFPENKDIKALVNTLTELRPDLAEYVVEKNRAKDISAKKALEVLDIIKRTNKVENGIDITNTNPVNNVNAQSVENEIKVANISNQSISNENSNNDEISVLVKKINEANPDYKILTKEALNTKLFTKIDDAEKLNEKYAEFLRMELKTATLKAKEINNESTLVQEVDNSRQRNI